MKRIIFISLISAFLLSCQTSVYLAKQKIISFRKMEWLVGVWEVRTINYIFTEKWKKINDTTFSAESMMIVAKDTVFYDQMLLKPDRKFIYLTSKSKINPSGQMNIYKLTKITKNKIVFENPSNSEQRYITYHLKSPYVMSIYIEGNERSVESYDMKKYIKQ